jgi:UDP-glucose 4-epimerase
VKALVTGGAGFIGSHLVDALVADGASVTVVDDLSAGSRENLANHDGVPGFHFEHCSILDKARVAELLQGIDTVYHLATQCLRLSFTEPELVHEVNTTGTLNVLLGAVAARVRRFVYVSSSEVYGTAKVAPMTEEHPFDPTTIYGASKLAGELYTSAFHRAHGLSSVVVRPFNNYGPRAHYESAHGELIPKLVLRALTGQRPVIFGDGEQTRDFTYVDDTVRAILLAARSDALTGRAVNVARGQEVSVNEIVRLVLRACAREDLAPEHHPERPADVRRHVADVGLARRALGFEAQIDIEEGIARYVAWFKRVYPEPARLLAREQVQNWVER